MVELSRPEPGLAGLAAGEAATVAAMAAGAEVIYQATFFDGRWRGHPDFLFRVDAPSVRWPWSYEVGDAKLARRVKAAAILQTCSYSGHVERIQGSAPQQIHVVGGDFTTRSYRLADFAAYYRRVKTAFEAAVNAVADDAYTWPVAHCGVCRWAEVCDDRRRREDHLSLVAGMRRSQARKLAAAGLPMSPPWPPPPGPRPWPASRLPWPSASVPRPASSWNSGGRASSATSSSSPSRTGWASASSRPRRRATSSSTWRATPSPPTTASSTSSA